MRANEHLSDDERAYRYWFSALPIAYFRFDEKLRPFLDFKITSERHGWLKQTRLALQLSCESVAQKAGLTTSSYSRIERAELDGSVTLEAMNLYAAAMGCEFVYAIRPRSRLNYSRHLWEQLKSEVSPRVDSIPYLPPETRLRKLATLAQAAWRSPKQRKRRGWCERKNL